MNGSSLRSPRHDTFAPILWWLLCVPPLVAASACCLTDPDNVPPTVAIVDPGNGLIVNVGDTVEIVAEASDSDGVIAAVTFFVDGAQIGRDTASPYTVSWETAGIEGWRHVVEAVAEDDAGASTRRSITVHTSWVYEQPEQVDDGWETGSLESVSVNRATLVSLMNRLRDTDEHLVHGIVIARHGLLVFEQYFDGLGHPTWGEYPVSFDRETVHGLSSVTKSFTATLLGIAIDRGFIPDVNTPVFDYFPELAALNVAPRSAITLRHLVTMSSGLEWDEWTYSLRDERNDLIRFLNSWDPLRFVLSRPVVAEPGTVFTYSGGNTNVLGEAIGRATGMRLDAFSDEYLFAPLEIDDYSWLVLRRNYDFVYASGDLRMRPRDMLKIGQLYLQDGIWNDARIVPHDWVAASAATYLPVPGWDAHWGYSYGWWPQDQRYGHGAFAASGWGQQAIIVMPELDMVAVFTGGSYWETPPLTWHQMMIGYVLPAVVATPVASKAGKSN